MRVLALKGPLCLLALVAAAAAACAPASAASSQACDVPRTFAPETLLLFTAPLPRSGGCGDVNHVRVCSLSLDTSFVFVPGNFRFVVAFATLKNLEAILPRDDLNHLISWRSYGSCVLLLLSSDVALVPGETHFFVALRHLKNLEVRSPRSSSAHLACFDSYLGLLVASPVSSLDQFGRFVVAFATFKNFEAPLFGSSLTTLHDYLLNSSFLGYRAYYSDILSSRVFGTWDSFCGVCVASTLLIVLVFGGTCLVVAFATFKNLETSPSSSSLGIGYTPDHLVGGFSSLAAKLQAASLLATPLSPSFA